MRIRLRRLALLLGATLPLALGVAPATAQQVPVPGPGLSVAAGAAPLPKGLSAASFMVTDLGSGEILAAKDAHHRLLPASTLKILTGLTLIPRVPKYSTVIPSFDDVNVEGSRVGIIENQPYPAYQLFRAMLMASGNDAANAVASAAGGQVVAARLMNAEARRLGALDTHAVNPSGLDAAGQKSTAYDLTLIARAAMRLPDFRTYVSTRYSSINGKAGRPLPIASHDKLLYNYDGAIGIKNGYTMQAGATYVGAATRGGRTLVVTVLKAKPRVWPEVVSLLDWGFAAERSGAVPVGRLHDDTVRQVALDTTAPAPVRPVAAHLRSTAGAPALPLALIAGAGLVGLVALRRSRRRRRNPLRLRLPL